MSELDGRLPTISLLFLLLGVLRQLIVPVVATAVAAPGLVVTWVTVLLVPAVLGALVRLWTFSYSIDGDELVIRQGLLTRTERNIPLARIQNLDLVENPLHRALGVAEVRLETASGGKPEAVIRVLTHDQIDALRRQIRSRRGAETDAPAGDATATPPALLTQSIGDLTILGLLSNRGLLVVAAAAGLLQQTGFWENPERFEWLTRRLPAVIADFDLSFFDPAGYTLGQLVLVFALSILGFIVATRLLSVAWTLVMLYGFRLERQGDDFKASYGSLTRVTATLPRRRLQLLSIHRPLLGRPWRYASVKVETAGGGASSDQRGPGAARLWLAPLVDDLRADALVREAMPTVDPASVAWRPLAPRAARRMARRNAVMTTLLAAAVAWLAGLDWGFTVLPLAVPAAWIGHRFARRCAWGYAVEGGAIGADPASPRAIFFRSGAFSQRESLVPLPKIQCVALRQTPFDRRWRMATVRVDTAGSSTGGHRVEIPLLDVEVARRLADDLAARAAETTFRW